MEKKNFSYREDGPVQAASSLFQALGDPLQLAILIRLLESPATQKELRAQFEVSSGPLSRKMASLENLGLVERVRSHGPYTLQFGQEVYRLLRDVSDLELRQAEAKARVAESTRRALLAAQRQPSGSASPAEA